jgi:hypothetical protein
LLCDYERQLIQLCIDTWLEAERRFDVSFGDAGFSKMPNVNTASPHTYIRVHTCMHTYISHTYIHTYIHTASPMLFRRVGSIMFSVVCGIVQAKCQNQVPPQDVCM